MNLITLWVTALEVALITVGGFLLAFWYVRNRIIEKKQLGTSILKYFQGLFPVGVMFFGIYVILSFNHAIGSLIMVLATFFYIVSSVTYTIDKYDSVHRATILSLGYTRQEYAIRYLFKSSLSTWIIAALNFFVAQFIALVFIQIMANYEISTFENDLLYASLALMLGGFLLSIFKSSDILEVKRKE
ncbi:hypothetical protein [Athalassotoga saccharophila]|uniref:hypothetical protein n=1 Tax=Athalassotoga saccharophila TaxID=1441386 RepID=UPI00137B7EE6|nr:hypothetical protein [Athalassotoga saccharophila]BBJ28754.1 hypothetical protein ATHSA_1673 [Athalassotoga saccharophila]